MTTTDLTTSRTGDPGPWGGCPVCRRGPENLCHAEKEHFAVCKRDKRVWWAGTNVITTPWRWSDEHLLGTFGTADRLAILEGEVAELDRLADRERGGYLFDTDAVMALERVRALLNERRGRVEEAARRGPGRSAALGSNNAVTNDPCDVCGRRTDPCGFDVQTARRALVCDECAPLLGADPREPAFGRALAHLDDLWSELSDEARRIAASVVIEWATERRNSTDDWQEGMRAWARSLAERGLV